MFCDILYQGSQPVSKILRNFEKRRMRRWKTVIHESNDPHLQAITSAIFGMIRDERYPGNANRTRPMFS